MAPAIESVNEQLRALGVATPKPTKRPAAPRTGLKRTPFGQTKRQMTQWELLQYPTWEALLSLHGLDFWHCQVAQRSQPGWPDYVVFGRGWMAFVELKASNLETGRRGKVSVAQQRYKASIEAAGGEWRTWCLPDDWSEVDDYLNAKTGKGIKGTWRAA